MRVSVLLAVVLPATILGAIIGGFRVRYRHVEKSDLVAPPGYLAAKKLGPLVPGGDTGTGNATVLAIWFKRDKLGGLWVSRMNGDKASYIGHGELYLKAFEQGMKSSVEKQGRSLSIKAGQVREIAGRQFACVEALLPDADRRIAVTRVGKSELLVNADSPIADPDLHAAGWEALTDQVARLEAPEATRAVRSRAAGLGAAIGFGAAVAPGIALASILRRRR